VQNGSNKRSDLRILVKRLLEDKSLGQELANIVKVNPVVDPSAALTDPSNPDFKPATKPELLASLSAIVSGIDDEKIPDVYDAIKHSMTVDIDESDEDVKMSNKKVEESLRQQVRKIIRESNVKSEEMRLEETVRSQVRKAIKEMFLSETAPTTPLQKKPRKRLPSAAEQEAAAEKWRATAEQDAAAQAAYLSEKQPTMGRPGQSGLPVPDEKYFKLSPAARAALDSLFADPVKMSKKNLTVEDVEGTGLLELAREFGFANPNGVLQWINRILPKMRRRIENLETVELIKLETMNKYIAGLITARKISPEQAASWRNNPEIIEVLEDNKDFRIMFDKALTKAGM
jgi:hypothetical protein